MPVFKVAAEWSVRCDVMVAADSLKEAIAIAEEEHDLPRGGEYLTGSFRINTMATRVLNASAGPDPFIEMNSHSMMIE